MNHHARKPPSKKKKKKASSEGDDKPTVSPSSWVDSILAFETVDTSKSPAQLSLDNGTSLSVVTWNVLAHSYCSRKSQCHLPKGYQKHVFNAEHRRRQIKDILQRFAGPLGRIDVLCLQEVDLDDVKQVLHGCGYSGIETPRTEGGGAGGRVDSCAIHVRDETWHVVDQELIRLDDLAALESWSESDASLEDESQKSSTPVNSNLQGLQQSFLRRNLALLVRIQHNVTGETVVVVNCHLYWHPGYEFVKLCQAHYIMLRARRFCRVGEPFVLCGDLNSKPGGAVHSYLTKGTVNAKHYAPWYRTYDPDLEEDKVVDGSRHQLNLLTNEVQLLNVSETTEDGASHPRYLLDATLNRLCRWLRILGQDTALETDVEEKQRTGEGRMVLFERCRQERRTLVTTSTRLQQRTDCPPGTYLISPTYLDKLEIALVHMLLTHGIVLEPDAFLSRCVICNGCIQEVSAPDDKVRILQDYQAPVDFLNDNLQVYQCDGCRQGYWWCDRPTSSASRVKGAATRLFELCLRAGVPIRGPLSMFNHVDVKAMQQQGWDFNLPGSELMKQKLEVIEWLRCEKLECPFRLESAYSLKVDGVICGERVPFTNVTHGFVNTLDYIFLSGLCVTERLKIPTSFQELNTRGIEQGHLLPSDVWPSDHLCLGAKLGVPRGDSLAASSTNEVATLSCEPLGSGLAIPSPRPVHGQRCDCGCVPNIPSLFEMAELRKKALREK